MGALLMVHEKGRRGKAISKGLGGKPDRLFPVECQGNGDFVTVYLR